MIETCEHGTPTSSDCKQCRELLNYRGLMGEYVRLKNILAERDAEIARLRNIMKECPVCSELERNIKP